ncbi:MAG TPA: hypothetical protein PKA90_04835 [Ignavibacteria bacterium]|nr:hypothetical protein [Ignavibacteria bacterium]HMR39734.1 hypothetical protein [Ignavibacteria bacterium]
MKNKESNNKKDTAGRTNYGKYLFFGVLLAIVVLFVTNYYKEDVPVKTEKEKPYLWSAETDSQFVKNCYEKYKPQVKDDLDKQVASKAFCHCMLDKIKSKYSEYEMHLVKDAEIRKWDEECREANLWKN